MFERSRAAVTLQPCDEALLGAFGQQVHHLVSLEVHQDRSVTGPATEGEVVDAEDLHFPRAGRGSGWGGAFGPPEQGVAAGEQPQLGREPGPGPAAQFQHDRQQGLLQAVRLASTSGDLGQPLAEDTPFARGLVAKEAPRADFERHGDPMPGQIRDRARVAAVRPGGAATADRADAPPHTGRHG
jgi:hypothetical protein